MGSPARAFNSTLGQLVGEVGRCSNLAVTLGRRRGGASRDPPGPGNKLTAVTALMGLAARLKTARLFFATDARPESDDLGAFASEACTGGVRIVGLSDGSLSADATEDALDTLRRAAARSQAVVGLFGDVAAAEFTTDLLVLPDDASSSSVARQRLHPHALLGRSCHTAADVDAACADDDIDFLIVTANLSTVEHAAAVAPQGDTAAKPWFAAGGVTPDYAKVLLSAGCRRILVGRTLARAHDPRAMAAAFDEVLRAAWDADPAMEAVTFAAFGLGGPAES